MPKFHTSDVGQAKHHGAGRFRLGTFQDPATGDPLSTLEYATRQIQQALRSPWFLLSFNLATLLLFLLGWREQWNYFASWLAIMVEWIVGTYMFGQTRRDAIILRQLLATVTRVEVLEQTAIHKEDQLLGAGDTDFSTHA